MSGPFFLVDAERLRASDRIVLDGAEGRHATVVRRIGAGESVDLTDGEGHIARCVVVEADRSTLTCDVRKRVDVPAPTPRLVVAQALAKGDRGELAVEMMTEIGVDEIVPWSAQRSVVRWEGPRGERALPVVTSLATARQLADLLAGCTLAVVLHEEATIPLGSVDLPADGDIVLVIGPEGGIAPDELDVFAGAGARLARMGPTVLRTSTAGAVAAGVVLSRTARWTTRP
jgi:16S rRNA (uracil1498-N3)-methyltransferase